MSSSKKPIIRQFDWKRFLKQESCRVVADYNIAAYEIYPDISDEILQSEWLGFPGASEQQIIEAEDRLGIELPPSYRAFLRVSNGWNEYSFSISLRSVETVEWFCTKHQDWIDTYTVSVPYIRTISDKEYLVYGKNVRQVDRFEYLQTALQISDVNDLGVILLNPEIRLGDEWEAWHFSNDGDGARRYQTFIQLFQELTSCERSSNILCQG
jgi:hypothetical protein